MENNFKRKRHYCNLISYKGEIIGFYCNPHTNVGISDEEFNLDITLLNEEQTIIHQNFLESRGIKVPIITRQPDVFPYDGFGIFR